MEMSQEIGELLAALSAFQAECHGAGRGGTNPHLRNSYTRLEDAWAAAREPLTRHGLSVSQWPCEAPEGHVGMVTVLGHGSGQWMRCVQHMPVSAGKGTTGAQQVGSALSYARRYAMLAVLGLPSVDDDAEGTRLSTAASQLAADVGAYRSELEGISTEDGLDAWRQKRGGLPNEIKIQLAGAYGAAQQRAKGSA